MPQNITFKALKTVMKSPRDFLIGKLMYRHVPYLIYGRGNEVIPISWKIVSESRVHDIVSTKKLSV